MHLSKGSQNAHSIAGKVYERDPQTLSEVMRLVEKLNPPLQVTATLSTLMVNMMSNDDDCFGCGRKVILVATTLRCSATTVMILAISLKTAPRKLLHQEHLIIDIVPIPTHIIMTAVGKGHTHSMIDVAKETALTGQDCTIGPSATEALVTTEGMHPIPYLTTIAVVITPPQTGTIEDIPTGIPHTDTGAAHLVTHHGRTIPDTTPLIIVGQAPGTPWPLPMIPHQESIKATFMGRDPP